MRGPGSPPAQRVDLSHHLVDVDTGPGPDGEADAAIVAARLWSLGAVGVEEKPDRLVGAFADAELARSAAVVLGAPSPHEVEDDRGLDGWRAHATSYRAGPFVVHPPWLEPPSPGIALSIDPGRSFGSGSHPSTRLALRVLSEVVAPHDRVLDVGCGSGVLAIAAARLGAAVVATDVAPEALVATITNVERNDVADRVAVGPATDITGHFAVVVVNMTIDLQEQIAPQIRGWIEPEGDLIVAGILAGPQAVRVASAHRRAVTRRLTEGEWVGLALS